MKSLIIFSSLLLLSLLHTAQANTTIKETQKSSSTKEVERLFNTPVNYNFSEIVYEHLSYGQNLDSNVLRAVNEGMFNENWIYNFEVTGELLNEESVIAVSNTASFVVSHRSLLTNNLDFVIGGGLAYAELEFGSFYSDATDSDFGLKLASSLRYGFINNTEATLSLHSVNLHNSSATTLSSALFFYPTEYFSLGVVAGKTFAELDSTFIGASVRFDFE